MKEMACLEQALEGIGGGIINGTIVFSRRYWRISQTGKTVRDGHRTLNVTCSPIRQYYQHLKFDRGCVVGCVVLQPVMWNI